MVGVRRAGIATAVAGIGSRAGSRSATNIDIGTAAAVVGTGSREQHTRSGNRRLSTQNGAADHDPGSTLQGCRRLIDVQRGRSCGCLVLDCVEAAERKHILPDAVDQHLDDLFTGTARADEPEELAVRISAGIDPFVGSTDAHARLGSIANQRIEFRCRKVGPPDFITHVTGDEPESVFRAEIIPGIDLEFRERDILLIMGGRNERLSTAFVGRSRSGKTDQHHRRCQQHCDLAHGTSFRMGLIAREKLCFYRYPVKEQR